MSKGNMGISKNSKGKVGNSTFTYDIMHDIIFTVFDVIAYII